MHDVLVVIPRSGIIQENITGIIGSQCELKDEGMRVDDRGGRIHVTILPGEYYVTNEAVTICTLLGSCIAACLYDPVNRVFGMNHFLLSNKRYTRTMPAYLSDAGRFGIHAMELLINDMLKHGAKRANLRAKAFGGGSFFQPTASKDNFLCVGDVNVRFIREFLITENIPLVSSDLGGAVARVIHFAHEDYTVHVKRFKQKSAEKILLSERQFWQKTIETQEKVPAQVEVWD